MSRDGLLQILCQSKIRASDGRSLGPWAFFGNKRRSQHASFSLDGYGPQLSILEPGQLFDRRRPRGLIGRRAEPRHSAKHGTGAARSPTLHIEAAMGGLRYSASARDGLPCISGGGK
jgi:hypothetical protein